MRRLGPFVVVAQAGSYFAGRFIGWAIGRAYEWNARR